jgi:hypothetical protein
MQSKKLKKSVAGTHDLGLQNPNSPHLMLSAFEAWWARTPPRQVIREANPDIVVYY